MTRNPTAFFWSKVTPAEGCWEWQGRRVVAGYGELSTWPNGKLKKVYAHRFSYELHKGMIPEGLLIRHTCDNPCCVNPGHLLVGTQKDNAKDMASRGRQRYQRNTHCKQGHLLSGDNLRLLDNGHRKCITCLRAVSIQSSHRYDAKKRAERKYVAGARFRLIQQPEMATHLVPEGAEGKSLCGYTHGPHPSYNEQAVLTEKGLVTAGGVEALRYIDCKRCRSAFLGGQG